MKSTVKKISECKREIEVEIDENKVTEEFKRVVAQFSSRAKIPGFRPGKAPKDMVKRMFYPEIKKDLINSLAPEALNNELKAQSLNPIAMPVVSDLNFKEGQPLRLKAQFEVWPVFNLPQYKNIRVKKKGVSVTDQEINQTLEELRIKTAQYVPSEARGVVNGDYVIAEIKRKDRKSKKILLPEKLVIIAGHPDNEKTLNAKLIGLKPNEESSFILNYEKNHANSKLAGKKIEYNLKIISIKERKLPEINDDFAKDLGEYENLKDLTEKIKKEIIASKKEKTKNEMAEEIIERISDKLSFGLPETLVEQEYLAVMKCLLTSRSQQNFNKEDIEELKVEGRRKAKQNVKNHFILREIAKRENLDVSEEEIHEELKRIAKANNLPLARVIDSINKEGKREELRNNILIKKTVDFLVEHAIII